MSCCAGLPELLSSMSVLFHSFSTMGDALASGAAQWPLQLGSQVLYNMHEAESGSRPGPPQPAMVDYNSTGRWSFSFG